MAAEKGGVRGGVPLHQDVSCEIAYFGKLIICSPMHVFSGSGDMLEEKRGDTRRELEKEEDLSRVIVFPDIAVILKTSVSS